jgi:hypothetical protein
MWSSLNRFEIQLTKAQALQGSHPGPCDLDIRDLLTVPAIKRQLNKIPAEKLAEELKDYGAWDDTELQDVQANKERILWIACGNIREEINQ